MAGRARPPREDPAHVGDGSQGKPGPGSSGSVGGTSCSTSSSTSSSTSRSTSKPRNVPCSSTTSSTSSGRFQAMPGQIWDILSHMSERQRPENALPVMPKWRRIEAEKIFSRELRSLAESSRAEGHLASEVTPLFRPTPRGKGRPASGSTSPIPQQPPLIQNQYPFQKPAQHTPN